MVHEHHPSLGEGVDVRRRSSHHAAVVGTDVPHADIVTPDDEDIGAFCGLGPGWQLDEGKQGCNTAHSNRFIEFSLSRHAAETNH